MPPTLAARHPARTGQGTVKRGLEVSLYVNDAFLAHYNKPARARLRGLVRNPAIPGTVLRRLVNEQFTEVRSYLSFRLEWSNEQFEALIDHPEVLCVLAEGPMTDALRFTTLEPLLPRWAYRRLIERDARLGELLATSRWVPWELREQLSPTLANASRPAPVEDSPLNSGEAEAIAGSESEWTRAGGAADPRLPVDLVARLAVDPSPMVRLAVSMRPELSEEERAAIDYQVAPDDRIDPAHWATVTRNPQEQCRCVYSAHIGLRRSVAYNPSLSPDLVAVLATDDDFAVRLLLCENHADVPPETVLDTYLKARTITRGRLLHHPAFKRVGLARLTESPDPSARCLAVLDPEAPAELLERLSHDPHPAVRTCVAADPRLSRERALELFDDPLTTGEAAANPHLPVPVMERILAGATSLSEEQVEGTPTMYLGNWKPDELPADET
ncbi:hypothetical protein [Micromonospora sp. IBHARD004]|uniref:hypothetical protein n=1 Tax=Micromonospora sp. IBHARD004 TaxID=3457764 RepID=UPI0040585420